MSESEIELSPTKRAVREAWLRGEYRALPIVRRAPNVNPPLSFAQERLWYVDRLQPGGTAYNLYTALPLRQPVDAGALERALGEIVRRHETLRTTFREVSGTPVQVIAPPFGGIALPVEDLSGLSGKARDAEVRRHAARARAHVFDLSAGPLLRAWLLRLAPEEHVLLICIHHIVGDAWSQKLMVQELRLLYDAFRQGRESPLPELPIQYADYAAWQRSEIQRAESLHLAYWKLRLAGIPELLALPTDHPRPPVPSFRGGRAPVSVPPVVVERLRELARNERATLHMVVLGAFQVLLSTYAGMEDVSVGTPVTGRTRKEAEGLIGLFVNMVVLRTELSGDPTFREVVGRVREVALSAYQHQDLPFERVVAALKPGRSLSHSLFFQVSFLLDEVAQPATGEEPASPAAGCEPGTTQFDLTLVLAAGPRGLFGWLEYATDLFEHGTAERMAAHLARVLEQVAYRPELRLSRLELLDEAEQWQVVEAWNATDAEHAAGRCVHHLFEDQVERTPDSVAVSDDDGESLTYRELNARANRLAYHLRARGVGPEARVGIFLKRGVEMVISILSVLKAGGAYVPLDPASPEMRLRRILADSGTGLVLTREQMRTALPADVEVVSLDAAEVTVAEACATNPESGASPRSLAYVIHTSGSTGAPKGVGIEHAALANHMSWLVCEFALTAADRVLQRSSVLFDASIWEFHAPLLVGGELIIARPGDEGDPAYLARTIRRRRVTTLQAVPSLLRVLLDEEEFAGCTSLRHVFCGGEALPPALWGRFSRIFPRTPLINLYGPAECCINTSTHVCASNDAASVVVPIGRPVANTRSYVLDASMRPVPVGVPGELFVGGTHVGRGYLGLPGATAERFVPDPFGHQAGGRLYRTGDRARWLTDGQLEFLGRLDEQVKVRGIRIEPGEVESTLSTHPGVREARVVAREDAPGENRLIAYVVGEADAAEMRAHLRRSLPDYMVPAAFVSIRELPFTPSGKLDRKALPAPDRASATERHVEPSTPEETLLARIWAEVLRLDRVSVGDSFFELGGDSLLSIQVVSRARQAGLHLTPRQIVECPTITDLAAAAGQLGGAAARVGAQGRVTGRVKPTPIQAWFFELNQPVPWHFNQDAWMRVDKSVTETVLDDALRAVLEHHDALRLRFRRTDAGWEQWHAADVGIALERVDLSSVAPEAQERVQDEVAGQRQASLDLEQGPVGRAVLFDRGERGRELLLILHHLVVDGISWQILREDLERACARAQAGEPIDLGPKGTSFQQWSAALEAYAASGELKEESVYWLAQGPEGVPPLPTDGNGGQAIQDTRSISVRLEPEETRALLHEVPGAYRTRVSDVLVCALVETVGEWTGSPRVRLAMEGYGREEEAGDALDLTRTVGWFTSLFPMVLDVSDTPGPEERLKRVKERLRAVPRHGIGYGVLLHLCPDPDVRRALSAHPEPEVAFNYKGRLDQRRPTATWLHPVDGHRGRRWAAENHRPHLLSIDSGVIGGCLQLTWAYGEGTHRRETVERVANAYLEAVRALIAHCAREGAGGHTASER